MKVFVRYANICAKLTEQSDAVHVIGETGMAVEHRAHPWMANSAPGLLQAMLAEIGASSVADVFEQIPQDHLRKSPLMLPPALNSEIELRRDLITKLRKNHSCEDHLNFLGSGCWQHHVPAVVDEIVGRTEFATNVWGSY